MSSLKICNFVLSQVVSFLQFFMSNLDCFDFDYFSVEKQTGKNKIKKKKMQPKLALPCMLGALHGNNKLRPSSHLED